MCCADAGQLCTVRDCVHPGMRHVFRLKANLSLQSWVTVLNPILPHGWPPQWAMTLDPHVLETPSAVPRHLTNSPELRHSRRDVRESASSPPVNDAVNKTEAEVEGRAGDASV